MRLITLILLMAHLMACTHIVEKPVQIPVEVKVPVMIPCVTETPRQPLWATQHLTGKESECELVTALLTERTQQKIFIEQLQASMAGCVAPQKERQENYFK